MTEPPERINYSADYPIQFQCGCRVTFLGSVHHRGYRLERCYDNRCGRDEATLIADAQQQYMLTRLGQPAV